MIPATEGIKRLREGNRRYVSGTAWCEKDSGQVRQHEYVERQQPFAAVLSCSDSRVPLELIFDQGLGDLFVIRVAGNIAAPSQIGSIEFAVQQLDTRLVVVMGHTRCGAIRAALEEIEHPTYTLPSNLQSIVDRIRPSVQPLYEKQKLQEPDEIIRQACQANVAASLKRVRDESPTIRNLIKNDGLMLIGAEYSLETGIVEFLDETI